jgi:lipoic acid synthetase
MANTDTPDIEIINWESIDYSEAFDIQRQMVAERIEGKAPDRLLMLSHPPVVTLGRSSGEGDLFLPESMLAAKGIQICRTDRGGKATYHGPGQLVVYPIMDVVPRDIPLFVQRLLDVISSVLRDFGLEPELKEGNPGVWVHGGKIASIGISLKQWISYHGIAMNVSTDLSCFDMFSPCGMRGQKITSMEKELGTAPDMIAVKNRFEHHFRTVFNYRPRIIQRQPDWLKLPARKQANICSVDGLIREKGLETVCEQARCPNLGECFENGTATFMILGKHCTRDCTFCAVEKGRPIEPDMEEPIKVAQAVKKLALKYAVITSVTRDDLADGGAGQFGKTIRRIRETSPETKVEVLVPDFSGSERSVDCVCLETPDMFNHNVETVPRLYPRVRRLADYNRSLLVLERGAKTHSLQTKSGLMLGLGETDDEIKAVLDDLLEAGCMHLTLGQYLAPTAGHIPVFRYVHPEEFRAWAVYGKEKGFKDVASGPLVRSSYHAELSYHSGKEAVNA